MEYTNFGEVPSESGLKPSKKWAMVGSITLTLCVCIGMICCFSSEVNQANDLQAKRVADAMKKMMEDPQHIVDAKRLAKMQLPSDLSLQTQAMRIADQLKDLMADADFVKDANLVAARVKAVMDAPIVQEQTNRFNEHMKTVVANLNAEKHQLRGRRLLSKPSASNIFRSSVGSRPLTRPKIGTAPQPFRTTRDVTMRAAETKDTFPLLQRLGELKFTTALAKTGALTAAEQGGVFSFLESLGAFSTAEKLLPIIDDLGVLQIAQDIIDTESGVIAGQGAALAALGPLYVALGSAGLLKIQGTPGLAANLLFTGTTGAGVALIALSTVIQGLQESEEPIELPGRLIRSTVDLIAPNAGGNRGVEVPLRPPKRALPKVGKDIEATAFNNGFFKEATPRIVDPELALGEVGFFGDKGRFWQDDAN